MSISKALGFIAKAFSSVKTETFDSIVNKINLGAG